MSTLEIRTIGTLLDPEKFKFFIPNYQRGYRWDPEQVEQLLSDLQDHWQEREHWQEQPDSDKSANSKPYYCLQPLVVKKRENQYEVVDGQQRLTTIHLLLTCLKPGASKFGITYETRKASEGFLESPNCETKAKENVDFHYMHQAYLAMDKWLVENEKTDEGNGFTDRLKEMLKQTSEDEPSVAFIWYEIPEDSLAADVFTRLNANKIPLSEDELLRAFFLAKETNSTKYDPQRIALEWEQMEARFRDPAFWYFLSKKEIPESGHLLRLFQLEMLRDTKSKKLNKSHTHPILDYYARSLKPSSEINSSEENPSEKMPIDGRTPHWASLRELFSLLEEWYADREIFHLIAFLVEMENDLNEVLKQQLDSAGQTKNDFRKWLKERVQTQFLPKGGLIIQTYLPTLSYEANKNKSKLRQTFLLFNICTLLNDPKNPSRFPFERFHEEKWDIEHIDSQAPDKLTVDYRSLIATYLEKENRESGADKQASAASGADDLPEKKRKLIALLRESTSQDEEIRKLLMDVFPSKVSGNGLDNLTLLDSGTNREFKNGPFPVKRAHVLEKEREGRFIPSCTRNVYLKTYTNYPKNLLHWTDEDAEAYKKQIIETIRRFFGETLLQETK